MTTLTSLADLLTGPTTGEQGRALVRALVATAPAPIPLEVLNTPGTPESAIIWAVGEAEAQRTADRLLFARSGFRSTASRAWLAIVAQELYGLPARAADFATTNVTILNSSGALYGPFAAGTLRFVNDTTDKVYTNTGEVTIAIGPSALTVGVVAIEPGTGSNASVGEIGRLETPLEGVSVTNPQPALGQDEESAESLNERISALIGAAGVPGSAGFSTGATASAFESIARNGVDNGGGVPREDGSRITVTRVQVVLGVPDGALTVYVADDDGPLAVGDFDLVKASLLAYGEWIGSELTVLNASAVPVTVSGSITIRGAAATNAAILEQVDEELVRAAALAPMGGFPPGSAVSVRFVENAVESAGDAGKPTVFTLVDITLSSPTTATSLGAGQVIVLSRGIITITRV